MSLTSIRSQIITLLDSIKATAGFDAVYYDAPTSVPVTPAVAVILDSFDEEYASNQGNTLNARFNVRVMVEKKTSDTNDQAQTTKLLGIVDSILDEFRAIANTTLSGETYYLLTTSGSPMAVGEIEQLKVFYVNILVEAKSYNSNC